MLKIRSHGPQGISIDYMELCVTQVAWEEAIILPMCVMNTRMNVTGSIQVTHLSNVSMKDRSFNARLTSYFIEKLKNDSEYLKSCMYIIQIVI